MDFQGRGRGERERVACREGGGGCRVGGAEIETERQKDRVCEENRGV